MRSRRRTTIDPRIPMDNAGTEHVGFSPNKPTLRAQSAKRLEVFGGVL